MGSPKNADSISSQVKEVVYTTAKTGKNPREEYQPLVHKTTSFSSSGEKSSDNDSESTGKKDDSDSEEDSDQEEEDKDKEASEKEDNDQEDSSEGESLQSVETNDAKVDATVV